MCRIRYLIAEMLDYAANAHAFIGDPFDPILAHFRPPRLAVDRHDVTIRRLSRNARMMQLEDFPTVVEHGPPRRTRCGIGLVMEKIREHIDDLVLTQAHLLWFATGMVDDVGPLRGD